MRKKECDSCGTQEAEPVQGWLVIEPDSLIEATGDEEFNACSWECVAKLAIEKSKRREERGSS